MIFIKKILHQNSRFIPYISSLILSCITLIFWAAQLNVKVHMHEKHIHEIQTLFPLIYKMDEKIQFLYEHSKIIYKNNMKKEG